jgi:AlkA N-terminal domain
VSVAAAIRCTPRLCVVRPGRRGNCLAKIRVVLAAQRVFDLTADPMSVTEVLGKDRLLAPLVERHPGVRIVGDWNLFECVVRAVLGRDLSVTAARTLTGHIVARSGQPIVNTVNGLTHVFPSPSALAEVDLRGVGLTKSVGTTIRVFARAVERGTVDSLRHRKTSSKHLPSCRGSAGPLTMLRCARLASPTPCLRTIARFDARPMKEGISSDAVPSTREATCGDPGEDMRPFIYGARLM